MDKLLTPGEFHERLENLRRRIRLAAERASRNPEDVFLLPATKNVSPAALKIAWDAGLRAFGENRIQEARAKIPLLPQECSWHFIGGLQRNKAKEAARMFDLIHSVDSTELAAELSKRADGEGKMLRVLVEVNVGGESAKHGVAPKNARDLVAFIRSSDHLRVEGMMTVPPWSEDPEESRGFFIRLRELRDRLASDLGIALPELSMGMTHDLEVAVEEGATLVRVGTALFGARVH
jgi:hypothetical protein